MKPSVWPRLALLSNRGLSAPELNLIVARAGLPENECASLCCPYCFKDELSVSYGVGTGRSGMILLCCRNCTRLLSIINVDGGRRRRRRFDPAT